MGQLLPPFGRRNVSVSMLRVVGRFVFFSIFFALFAAPGVAQWALNHTFNSQVRSVYFLDQQGSGSTGFVGLTTTAIWRTTDNGASWTQMTTPGSAVPIQITGFSFKNTTQGWCSVRENNGGTPVGGV